jgi:hypothetical protein
VADLWIDRVTMRLGAGPLVRGRPGLGWLLTECIPVFMWAQVTGALFGESFYLVTYLTLLGATTATLALLPLVAYAGNFGAAVLVLARHHTAAGRDAKRRCVFDTGLGRVFWLGTVVWPWAGLTWGWSPTLIISGVLFSIFLAQLAHAAGGAAFVVWTQALVPRPLRPRFWVWRNCVSFAVTAVVVLMMGLLLPKGTAAQATHLPWLMAIFAIVTGLCLASTWMLGQCPDMPEHLQEAPRPPLRQALATTPGYAPLLLFNVLTVAAMAISMAYLPTLLHERGVATATFAATQAWAFFPAMLGGIFLAGWMLHRLGGQRLLTVTAALLLACDGAFLVMPDAWWLGPCLMLSGIAKGMWGIALVSRQQELCPAGDTRFPALLVGLGALGAMAMAGLMHVGVPLLEGHVTLVAWTLMAIAAGLRVGALMVLLLNPARTDHWSEAEHRAS